MAYKALPIVDVRVDKLRLDLQNYRIPIAPDDEASALNYLFASEDVLDQIKLFLRDGYFDNEVPIAVKEGGEHVVLEGNRRVSALKAIATPGVVPSHQTQVEELRTRYATEVPNMPQTIRVLEVPSREFARKHVARLHTGVPKKRWSRDQQANYYFSLLGPGVTAKDLKALYPDVDIMRFLRMHAVRQFLSGVKFRDRGLRQYVQGAELTMSSFEYAYRNATIAAAVGLKFDSEGKIQPPRKKPKNIGASLPGGVRDALEYLMEGFRTGDFNTRSPTFKLGSAAQTDLISRLLSCSGKESTDPDDEPEDELEDEPGRGGGPGGPGGGPGGGRGPNDPDTRKGLSVTGLPFDHVPSNLQKRVLELRKINVEDTPAAAAMLLRSVFEATIKWHFTPTATSASGMLGTVFPTVVSTYGRQRALKDNINAIRSGAATAPGSLNWFNAASHNPDIAVKAQDVRDAYALVQPVLIRLMRPA